MAAYRKSSLSSLNFRSKIQPEGQKWDSKGLRPVPNPVTIKEALFTLLIDIFRRILFVNTNIKVGLYLAGLFFSFIFDFLPFPRTYLSDSQNIFNQYFVKIGWFWTLLLTTPFVFLTSFSYCCGKKKPVLIHLSRLFIATIVWYAFTSLFATIEEGFGKCSTRTNGGKRECISNGHSWFSLDISGHAFLLIWSALVITEESKAIIGWNQVGDSIQREEYLRTANEVDISSNLRNLSNEELSILKSSYNKFSIYVKGLFVALTMLTMLWDLMILSTIFYFHIMVEKIIAGLFAIAMWFVTYKYWYPKLNIPPQMPGEGSFKYMKNKVSLSKYKG